MYTIASVSYWNGKCNFTHVFPSPHSKYDYSRKHYRYAKAGNHHTNKDNSIIILI